MGIVRATIAAADAGHLVSRSFSTTSVRALLRDAAAVDVIAAGKASGPMLRAFNAECGVAIRRAVAVGMDRPGELVTNARWYAARHPIPDEGSVRAARAALDVAGSATGRDLVVVLLSGGASSLLALPAEGLTLEDKQATITALLMAGADIGDLNVVRKHLSGIKGGRLAAACSARMLTLAVSDVIGDDPSLIGSGPTVGDPSTFQMAEDVLRRFGGPGRYPPRVTRFLARGTAGEIAESPRRGDGRLACSTAAIIGGCADALEGASLAARSMGYSVRVIAEAVQGEARTAAIAYLASARRLLAEAPRPLCVLSAGETTVHVTGGGRGGRNQEFALAMATGLRGLHPGVVVASVGTDGVDGPTDAAGAIVDTTTAQRARDAGLGDPQRYLDNNDSYDFFLGLGDLIQTGPTATNVGDIQIMLIAE